MRNRYQINVGLCRPVLIEKIGKKKTIKIIADAEDVFLSLKNDTPKFQSIANKKLFDMTFFIYPIYKSLLNITFKDEALCIVKACSFKVLDSTFSSSWILRKIHSSPTFIRLLRRWIIRNVNSANEKPGWKYADYIADSSTLYEFKVIKCGIYNLFKKLGTPELTPIICELDHYILKYYPENVELVRAKTIAEGAKYCQFHFTCPKKC